MEKRIAITGIGVLAPNGIGKTDFWKAIKEGKTGIKPVTLFDTSNLRAKLAGEISNFDPKAILGLKGLRNLDRTTLLALCASKLALEDANLPQPVPEADTDTYGVSLGSTIGSMWSVIRFDKDVLESGARSVNPALFPFTVENSPASHISIRFNIQGFNSTISTGFCSSIDAIYYAINMIQSHNYKVVLTGGIEELCEETYRGFHKIGHLAGSRPGKKEVNCPFDKRRNGILEGEGACIVVLEELEHALARGASIYAEALGYGTAFDPASNRICSTKAEGAEDAIRYCLKDANLSGESIDYISASANSTLDCDFMETKAVKNVFGEKAKSIPISSIKSMIGDSFSAAGAMNLAAALGAINRDFIPPTINYEKPDSRCDLDYVPNGGRKQKVNKVLVNSFSPTGSNSVLAIGKYE